MKKNLYLFVSLMLFATIILFDNYFYVTLKNYNNISEWGDYLLLVPLIYCLVFYFSNFVEKPTRVLVMILSGVLTAILLSRDLPNGFWGQKSLASIAGALGVWILNIKIK